MSFLFAIAVYVIICLVVVWQVGLRVMPEERLPRKPWIGFSVNASITAFVLWKLVGGLWALLSGRPFLSGILSASAGPIFGRFCFGMLIIMACYLLWTYGRVHGILQDFVMWPFGRQGKARRERSHREPSEERRLLTRPKSLVMSFAGCVVFLLLMWLSPISYFQDSTDYGAAPHFELKDTEGRVHKLSDYAESGVVLSFWATWCSPCQAELPLLSAEAARDDSLPILGISTDSLDELKAAYEYYAISYPTLYDVRQEMIKAYEVSSYPTTVLVGPGGRILAKHTGLVSPALLETWRRWTRK